MDFNLDEGWQLHPVGGNTGSAYMGVKAQEKVFLKRNSSPFLAALSAEGITPKLIWTKRMSTGDVLTAQEWLNGRALTTEEMQHLQVAKLLGKVHRSTLLKRMLQKVGGKVIRPFVLVKESKLNLTPELRQHDLLMQTIDYLEQTQPRLKQADLEVCHGDLNRKNWLLSENNRLYLVDWDSAMLADSALDLGMLLTQYVPQSEWSIWLKMYGVESSKYLMNKVTWYGCMMLVLSVEEAYHHSRFYEMNKRILMLEELMKNITAS